MRSNLSSTFPFHSHPFLWNTTDPPFPLASTIKQPLNCCMLGPRESLHVRGQRFNPWRFLVWRRAFMGQFLVDFLFSIWSLLTSPGSHWSQAPILVGHLVNAYQLTSSRSGFCARTIEQGLFFASDLISVHQSWTLKEPARNNWNITNHEQKYDLNKETKQNISSQTSAETK